MTDKKQAQEAAHDIQRANQAAELLANPLYIEALTAMRGAMYMEFENTKLAEPEARHELWQRMQLMKGFVGKFESIVKQGKRGAQTIALLDADETRPI